MKKLAISICLGSLLAACGSIPVRTPPPDPPLLTGGEPGTLDRVASRISGELEPGQSASWLLARADFSYIVRLALVAQAVRSLDIQYFIWEKDPTSRLFAESILMAADRGVQVRVLLDDLTLNGQDGEFSALESHPNITVRTFNPWKARSNVGRVGELMLNFGRLNHRMHNKTVIADGQFAILGGRNIGDRYFGSWEDFVQNDLDIMTTGPAAIAASESFDDYWYSAMSYALADVARPRARAQELTPTRDFIRSVYQAEQAKLEEFFAKTESWDGFFDDLVSTYTPGECELWQDSPDVHLAQPDQLYAPLLERLAMAEERVLLSTAYLVPDQQFVDLLEGLVERGVEVTLLTNSLASNNHMVAHTAYKQRRKKLLRIGVNLYEARDDSAFITEYSTPPVEPTFLGLHSKAIVIDDRYSFIGSPNIDPRSLIINTEIGYFCDGSELAAELIALVERDISPDAAWRVYFDERGRLRWESSAGIEKNQPALGLMQRVTAFFINLLPLKSQA